MFMGFRQAPRGLRRLCFFIVCGLFFLVLLRHHVSFLDLLINSAYISPASSPPTKQPAKPTIPLADPFAKHAYLPNGLLEVNPDAPHPIFALIKDAEAKWEAKLNRASKTLEETVEEYKRRYKRAPPKGFDDWLVLCFVYIFSSMS